MVINEGLNYVYTLESTVVFINNQFYMELFKLYWDILPVQIFAIKHG